ncbi:MAG: acetylornithine deacetylase [Rhizobiaceae bacterium]
MTPRGDTGADAVDILQRLISFPTVSANSNLDLIAYCRRLLGAAGIDCRLYPSADGGKAGLAAVVGPMVTGGVVLSGHSDVVPTDGQTWTSDPWVLTKRGARLHARGAADMKGFLALALSAAVRAATQPLKRPLVLAVSYDEEIGCAGGKILARTMATDFPRPAIVIVGEPTRLEVVDGHKSYLSFKTTITGRAIHSSRADLGVSAIAAAAQLIALCSARMRRNARVSRAHTFEPPYTTINCGLIEGGTGVSTVAETAAFTTDIRCVPGERPADYASWFKGHARRLEKRMRELHRGCGIVIDELTRIPGLEPDKEAARMVARWSGTGQAGTVSYGTEAGLFQEQGWPTVVCGPGDIIQAHCADEFIEESEIARAAIFLDRAVRWLSED